MKIAGRYSFNGGDAAIKKKYGDLLAEVEHGIAVVDADICKTKRSLEKTMRGRVLYSPIDLNVAFQQQFYPLGWKPVRVKCDYPKQYYCAGYNPKRSDLSGFREMDFIKRKLGMEVQLGKYAFMVYNVAAKMTIFKNLGHIDAGVEVVPMKDLAEQMSTGVSYFEQFVWDLENRGVSNIDIPVLVIGIDCDPLAVPANKNQTKIQ